MSEINLNKYRVWDKEQKKYVNDRYCLLEINQGYNIQMDEEIPKDIVDILRKKSFDYLTGDYRLIDFSNFHFQVLELEKSTGFADKFGKEIFHNDIIKIGKTKYKIVLNPEYNSFYIDVYGERMDDWLTYKPFSRSLAECSELLIK